MTPPSSIIELMRLSPTELRKDLARKRAECARLRIGITMQSEKNHASYRALRKEIAVLSMVLNGMERGKKIRMPAHSTAKSAPPAAIPPESTGTPSQKPVQRSRSKSRKAA